MPKKCKSLVFYKGTLKTPKFFFSKWIPFDNTYSIQEASVFYFRLDLQRNHLYQRPNSQSSKNKNFFVFVFSINLKSVYFLIFYLKKREIPNFRLLKI